MVIARTDFTVPRMPKYAVVELPPEQPCATRTSSMCIVRPVETARIAGMGYSNIRSMNARYPGAIDLPSQPQARPPDGAGGITPLAQLCSNSSNPNPGKTSNAIRKI